MRFIHAADIHLDSPLLGLSAYPDAPAELLRGATREAFSKLISEAIDQQVDFMVIAGDLYDGTWKDHNTGIYFCKEMGRLKKVGIPVFLLFGNHDAESEMTKKLQLPDNVFVFESRKAMTFQPEGLSVALHGRSFKEVATTENLVVHYPPPVPGILNIGVLHTALEGNAAHPNYAPCSVEELHAKGYQYWALGHVHEYKAWNGASTIVFPGNIQGRHIKEAGPRGAVLVTADDSGVHGIERLYVDVLRWHAVDVDVSACASLPEVARSIASNLDDLLESSSANMPLAVRVTVIGKTVAHGELFGMETQLRAEVIAHAASVAAERLWIEKVKINTTPANSSESIKARGDALADLQALLEQAQNDEDFLKGLQNDLMGLVTKAPLELQSSVSYFKEIRSGNLAELCREVQPGLVAHLAKSE
ncbi:metallophosphoesterase family protein [Paraburkholderia terrae]|uniref:metallophosphoesterase family protein n=1 Tax=Paraburkholderia terrae TaxID=311230 RepID=UPI00296AC123|nr:DNA repair exonuclease [Paraburkholderia terrae]MDW3657817.1 DNA repair exonuclease [Paraburkholderia terrae]